MRSGVWSGAKSTENVRVTVNGTIRPVDSVRVQSGMRDGDPRSDASSWCVEATIEWADPNTVTGSAPHPFGVPTGALADGATEWLPKPGDEVVIETGDAATGEWFVQHRGVIDDASGSLADGTARCSTVDRVDDLSYTASVDALQQRMPQWKDDEQYRRIGLQSSWFVDRMFRNPDADFVGWYATPPRTWETVGLATLQGSLWPEVGFLEEGYQYGDADSYSRWGIVDYGLQGGAVHAVYRLDTGGSGSHVLTAAVPPRTTSGDPWRINLHNSSGQGIFVRYEHDTDRIVYGVIGGSAWWITAESSGVRADRVALYSSGTELTIRLPGGRGTTQTLESSPWSSTAASRVTLICPGSVGWWMVERGKNTANRWASLEHAPTARIRPASAGEFWTASRDIMSEDAAKWIQEQVDAECATAWLDEDGVFQYAGRGVIDNAPVARTVTSVLDVDDIQWTAKRRRAARTVALTYLEGRIDQGWQGNRSRTLWSDNSIDCGPGELETRIVTPRDDHDWILVDTQPAHVRSFSQPWSYYVIGSVYGGTQYRRTDDEDQSWAQFIDCTMSKITNRSYLIEFKPWAAMSSAYRVATKYPHNPRAYMRTGGATLALRGRGITVWNEGLMKGGSGTSGPLEYHHDVGWRVQGSDVLSSLRSHLVTALTTTAGNGRPSVTGLTIEHDPRLQIGDKIRVHDPVVTGADFDMLIQERDINAGDFTETISGRVTEVRSIWRYTDSALPDSRHEPSGPTALTPPGDWNREAI